MNEKATQVNISILRREVGLYSDDAKKPLNHNLLLQRLAEEKSGLGNSKDGILDRYLAQEEKSGGLSEQHKKETRNEQSEPMASPKKDTPKKKPASGDSPAVKKIGDSD